VLHTVIVAIDIAATFTGLVAAGLWWRASLVPVAPIWGHMEPVERSAAQEGWLVALLETTAKSSGLNAWAAKWTAGSVVLTAVGTFAGLF
jgi:hypothetical protein